MEAECIVHTGISVILPTGQSNAALAQLILPMASNRVNSELRAILSVANATLLKPPSQRKLIRRIKRDRTWLVDGAGQHPTNQWPSEATLLILESDLEQARALGWEFAECDRVSRCRRHAATDPVMASEPDQGFQTAAQPPTKQTTAGHLLRLPLVVCLGGRERGPVMSGSGSERQGRHVFASFVAATSWSQHR